MPRITTSLPLAFWLAVATHFLLIAGPDWATDLGLLAALGSGCFFGVSALNLFEGY